MRLKFLWLAIGGILSAHAIQAQTDSERALLFSRITPGGSARIQGMGGAQTALGADPSSAHSNPAGLGMYNRSEMSVGIGIQNTTVSSQYFGYSKSGDKANFNIPNLAAIFSSRERNTEGFIGGTFGITYNRVNSFSENLKYQGTNNASSYVDRLLGRAWCTSVSELKKSNTYEGLALRNYLISDSTKAKGKRDTEYFSAVGINRRNEKDTRTELQQEDMLTKGNQGQLNFAYGGNYNDRIFFGFGIGISFLRYSNEKAYTESDFSLARPTSTLKYFTLNDFLTLDGLGLNATLGIIARPIDAVQVGLSYATPTSYTIKETWQAGMNSKWDKDATISESTQVIEGNYSLRTPSRLNAGLTFFIKKAALLTADLQMVNYGGAKFGKEDTDIDFTDTNTELKTSLKRVFNFRVGGEYRLSNYRIRAGYGMMPDSFKSTSFGINQTVSSYSLGAGYRSPKVNIDVAAVLSTNNFAYSPYPLNNQKDIGCEDMNGNAVGSRYEKINVPAPNTHSKRQNVSVVITATFPFSR